uniref:Ig-like domain-containing protein n=1 Tax=Naja naja TaxID=35670 RepID=A0A8C6YBY0_NAJNA
MKYHYLILFSGSLDKPLSVTPKTLSAWEGSCVFISCNIKEDSNQTATEVSSEFSNRVQFVGDLGSKNCSLKISQLHLSDNGSYGIRLYWIPGELKTSDKWFETLEIIVHKTPSELIKTVSPEMIEGNNYTVACSIPYYCYDELIELSIQGLESHHVSHPKMTTEIQTVQTNQSFMATWKDHGKQLTCHFHRNLFLYFCLLAAPKGVKILQKPEGRIQEPALVYLKCEVEIARHMTFRWYKNEELLDSTGHMLVFVKTNPSHSGTYHCEAENSVGRSRSPAFTLHIVKSIWLYLNGSQNRTYFFLSITLEASKH